jgi:antitoxin component of MazEF toxin-antitoxin module
MRGCAPKGGPAMETTMLRRWGNSQGFIIPKADCKRAGIAIGSEMEIRVDASSGSITLRPIKDDRRYRRERKVSAAQLLEGWDGGYELPSDLRSSEGTARGHEADWGTSVGKEMW